MQVAAQINEIEHHRDEMRKEYHFSSDCGGSTKDRGDPDTRSWSQSLMAAAGNRMSYCRRPLSGRILA